MTYGTTLTDRSLPPTAVARALRPARTVPERRRRCLLAGCSATTNGGKPYCTRHVIHLPYARRVAAEVARRDPTNADAA